jgi:membrane-associated phospholipid phosphatase
MRGSTQLANILSLLLSPVGIAFLVILIFTLVTPSTPEHTNMPFSLLLGILFFCVFPVGAILYSYRKGVVDIWVSDRATRTPFYIVAILGYLGGVILFHILHYDMFFLLSIAYGSVTTVMLLVNSITKVSTHMAGVAGPLTALTFVFGWNTLPLFLLIPLVMWARLKMKAHSYVQLLAGTIIAILVTSVIYLSLYS